MTLTNSKPKNHSAGLRVEVTQEMIAEAKRRGLTGEQLIEMAVALAFKAHGERSGKIRVNRRTGKTVRTVEEGEAND